MANSIRPRDAVFIRTGEPMIVRERDAVTGKLKMEGDRKAVHDAMRHGYLNGLTPENRDQLYEILDQVKGEDEDPQARVELLRTKLDELELDPRNVNLTRYLRAEMVHIMNSHGIKPREYAVHESKIR